MLEINYIDQDYLIRSKDYWKLVFIDFLDEIYSDIKCEIKLKEFNFDLRNYKYEDWEKLNNAILLKNESYELIMDDGKSTIIKYFNEKLIFTIYGDYSFLEFRIKMNKEIKRDFIQIEKFLKCFEKGFLYL